jgi:hypothetical protein
MPYKSLSGDGNHHEGLFFNPIAAVITVPLHIEGFLPFME